MPSFGTLKADTLTHSTAGSLATNFVVNGSLKAWRKYDTNGGTTNTESFNYSSITDGGTGDSTHTLTNSMSNTTYTVMHNTQFSTFSGVDNSTAQTTSAQRTGIYNASNSAVDVDQCFIHIAGDLA